MSYFIYKTVTFVQPKSSSERKCS